MIQLNLLPDVKLEYIKAQRSRRLVLSVSVLVCVLAIALLTVSFSYDLLQKKHLKDLDNDISTETSQLQHTPNINQVLTVQNQLESLTALHAAKPAASQLFGYLNAVTPAQVDISEFSIDFTQNTATITGNADALSTINQFVDTLKLTTYTTDQNPTPTKAFNNVVLSSFGLTSGTTNTEGNSRPASYTITMAFDKTIFDITKKVNLSVPSTTTTRLQLNQPNDLFSAPVVPKTGGTQ